MSPSPIHIAIDGPVASGKGTVARGLSEKLKIPCLDTGAIYRGIAIFAKEKGLDKFIEHLDEVKIFARIIDNVTCISINGKNVTGQLRDNDISQISSQVATIPAVRKLCTQISHELAGNQSLIAEGRDICSVVLPNATHKFYLTAKPRTRAKRRHDELVAKGKIITFKQVLRETKERDKRDLTKGGLVKTPDAITIDSTKMSIDETVQFILKYIIKDETELTEPK